jgi:membrane protease YdiL (CAAX protease family)
VTNGPSVSPEPASWLYGSRGNLRAVWRIGVVVCVYFLINGILQSILTAPITWLSSKAGYVIGAREWVDLFSALVTVSFVLSQIDRQQWSDVALHRPAWTATQLGRGTVWGSAAIALTAGTLLLTGQLHFEADPLAAMLLGGDATRSASSDWMWATTRITLLLAPSAFFEELVFRGYFWRVAEDSSNTLVALVITSVLFGLAHVQNPGVSQLAIVNVVLAGAALGLVRLYTNSLPAPRLQ